MGRPKVRTDAVRAAVLRSAVETLEREGPAAISARRVATDAGASTAALYEFFGDKAGLVRAIYLEGFAALRSRLAEVPAQDDPRGALVALLDAARRFAVERPLLFEVMYSRPFAEFSPDASDLRVGADVYRMTVAAVRAWLDGLGNPLDPVEAAHVIVAAHRGFVMSELAGIAGASRASVDARYRLGVDAVLDGLVAGAAR
ncbi:TetR/AcrR family transcriptional regulator [Pseudonocardia sp. TRM90224]|uniref:TetR/AcrR family transcriptional regulator n=1 Tax=Pseudonocardia sp. TRM90224 TaxID=2812678 RepID=UPI001E46A393|nr:TetR/AcrR family transcriptional regulator [Pseudonocardia sp. TRM90224]